jgi:2-oxoglutarate ferredoxin oxidoreductase subunit beta
MHDGTTMLLHKLAADYDPGDRIRAMNYLAERQAQGQVVTGLLYVDAEPEDLHASLGTVPVPLNRLGERELCPGAAALEKFNATLR